ncbi:hypothetical protein M1D80_00555 (plasmid) [Phyllobacteriaceae bacterium JZ32]
MTKDNNKTMGESHAEDKGQVGVPVKTPGTTADKTAGERQKGRTDTITIKAPPGPLELYKWYTLTVTAPPHVWAVMFNTGPETLAPAADKPGHTFMFNNDAAYMGAGGTIGIMAVGPNVSTSVTVYAVSMDGSNGSIELEFVASSSPPTSTLGLFALNGQPWRMEQENGWPYLVGAIHMNSDGTPGIGEITWTATSSGGTVSPLSQTTLLRDNGTSTNAITATGNSNQYQWYQISITATIDGLPPQTLHAFDYSHTPPPNITLTPDDAQRTLTATCPDFQDGMEVVWEAYPPDMVMFTDRRTTVSGGSTQNTIIVTATGDVTFTAYFAASAQISNEDSPDYGLKDYGTLQLQLTHTQPMQGVKGIEIDKASAISTWGVDIDDDTQVIKCQAKVLGVSGKQTVLIPTTPLEAGVEMWDATTGEPLSTVVTETNDEIYTMETDDDGVVTFLIGSANNIYFGVNVQWNELVSPTAQLALVSGSGTLPAPTIVPAVRDGVLTIPPDGRFFHVTIPTSRGVSKGDPVALVINNRVVWEGSADPEVPVEVAYSAFDLAHASVNMKGRNTLIYVTTGHQESVPASGSPFRTSGTPLTGPSDTVDRSLDRPMVDTKVGNVVGPDDIVDQGLKVYIPAYEAQEGDVITVFGYLSGVYELPPEPARNIVATKKYTVDKNSPLLSGQQTLLLPIPQWALAGYWSGQLQIDYSILTKGGDTLWSHVAPSKTTYFTLNTTF